MDEPVRDVSAAFDPEPERWGLRGDPYVWRAMRERLTSIPVPGSAADVDTLLQEAFEAIVGVDLRDPGSPEQVWREEFAHGGMSSGGVHLVTWRERLLPLLIDRLEAMRGRRA